MSYCKCKIASPSSHHDCCINPGCGEYIRTSSELLTIAEMEIETLETQLNTVVFEMDEVEELLEYFVINVIESHELKKPIHERTHEKAVQWLKNRNKG